MKTGVSIEKAQIAALAGRSKPCRRNHLKLLNILERPELDELTRHLIAGMTYKAACRWVEARTGQRISCTAMCEFYQTHCRARLMAGKAGTFAPGWKRIVILLDVRPDGGFEVSAFQPPAEKDR